MELERCNKCGKIKYPKGVPRPAGTEPPVPETEYCQCEDYYCG